MIIKEIKFTYLIHEQKKKKKKIILIAKRKLQDWLFASLLYIINSPFRDDNLHIKSSFLHIYGDGRKSQFIRILSFGFQIMIVFLFFIFVMGENNDSMLNESIPRIKEKKMIFIIINLKDIVFF